LVLIASGYVVAGSGVEPEGEYIKAVTLEADLENGQEAYAVCASCHLQEGWGLQDGTYPQIAGQHQSVLIRQLADIHAQNRDNPTMYPFALPETIGDEQAIADVTAYIANMKMSPDNGKGAWAEGTTEFGDGKKLFAENCVQCHGQNGEGDPDELYPKIQGQHYSYMLRQLEWMREGKRRHVKPDMLDNLNALTGTELARVANYVSRIPVSQADMTQ
jgi:cytochrome c553